MRDLPNFRDNGRTVDAGLLRLVNRLQARYGRAFASERSLRAMLHEDVGLMAGVSTIPKALVRLGAQGLVVQVWLVKGQILPDGSQATYGTRLVWCPQNRRQRATARSFNARQNRREPERNRTVPASQAGALLSKLAAGKALPTTGATAAEREATAQAAFDEKRRENVRKLAELAAQWEREGKPPDG
ncbi:MAG: hypothetical protein KGK07_13655 [Chloroflexota bacterium]|nr:hypothetical protein [Chloroflexota bacterium]